MATSRADLYPMQDWDGVREHEEPLEVGVEKVGVLIDRTQMTGLARPHKITFALWYSLDGGKSWHDTGSCATSVGEERDEKGVARAFSGLVRMIPEPKNPLRRIRVHFGAWERAKVAVEIQKVTPDLVRG